MIEAMRRFRSYLDRQGDHAVERALAYFIEDGELEAHVRRTRREYEARRYALMAALRAELGESLEFREPPGGLALWARIFGPKGGGRRGAVRCSEDWAKAALQAGVLVQAARSFTFDRHGRAYFRLGYARLDATELRRAVATLACTDCLRLLKIARKAIRPGARLLVIDIVLPPANEPHPGKITDLLMLVLLGGKERTLEEFECLLSAANFTIAKVIPTETPLSIIDAR